MRIPVNTMSLMAARVYAYDSHLFTHDHCGYEQDSKTVSKIDRITTGVFGQEWLAEMCRLNGIAVKKDTTTHMQNDVFDLKILDKIVEVKTAASDIYCQVNCIANRRLCDFYCFLKTDKNKTFIEPVGIIPKSIYDQVKIKVDYDSKIPGTNFMQKHIVGTYVLDREENRLANVVATILKAQKQGWDATADALWGNPIELPF